MFYDRPKKKIKRAPEVQTMSDGGTEVQLNTQPQERKKRFSLFRFFFLTPVHEDRAPREEDGYADAPEQYKQRRKHICLRILAAVIAFIAVLCGLLYYLPVGFFGSRSKALFSAENELPRGYVHVLLIGTDLDENGTSRSDTMMIASVARGDIKLTSLQRDTGVVIPGRSGYHRLNAAYAYGGVELLLKTVNTNFNLNITRYAMVDYDTFPKLIDRIGGVELAVTEKEIEEINKNLYSLLLHNAVTGKQDEKEAWDIYLETRMKASAHGENVHLNGLQALSYARIRKIDSDYGRTNRQRKVIAAAIDQAKGKAINPFVILPFVSEALSSVETNMNPLEIASIAAKALTAGMPEQTRLPQPGTYKDTGGMFENVDYKANAEYFRQFVYGK